MQTFLRTVARVVGSEAIDDVVAFFRAFEGMEAGFRDRALAVEELLAADETGFVLVTSPRRDAMEEAQFFARQLERNGQDDRRADREPRAPAVRRGGTRRPARGCGRVDRHRRTTAAARRLAALYENLADFREIAELERAHVEGVQARVGATAIAFVPYLARDVYDFAALREIGGILFDPLPGVGCAGVSCLGCALMTTILVAADAQWVRDQVRSAFVGPGQEVVEVTRGQDVRDTFAEDRARPRRARPPDRQHGRRRGRDRPAPRGVGRTAARTRASCCCSTAATTRSSPRRADVDLTLVKPVDAGVLRRAAAPLLAAAAVGVGVDDPDEPATN